MDGLPLPIAWGAKSILDEQDAPLGGASCTDSDDVHAFGANGVRPPMIRKRCTASRVCSQKLARTVSMTVWTKNMMEADACSSWTTDSALGMPSARSRSVTPCG